MGTWGINALDSDEGLALVEFLTEHYLKNHQALDLAAMIALLKENDFFGEDFDQVDFAYDHNAWTLGELLVEFADNGRWSWADKQKKHHLAASNPFAR